MESFVRIKIYVDLARFRSVLGEAAVRSLRRPLPSPTRQDRRLANQRADLLSQRVGGLFIYAAATVNFLDHHIRDPEDQLDAIIRHPKSTVHEGEPVLRAYAGLDSLYMSILQGSFCENRVKDDDKAWWVAVTKVAATTDTGHSKCTSLYSVLGWLLTFYQHRRLDVG